MVLQAVRQWISDMLESASRRSGVPQDRPERLPGLDGLRAIAVVAVILYHLDLPGALPAGFLGVDVFFTLSGFIITALLLREHERTGTVAWAAFCRRRAQRLLPPTFAMIATAVPVSWFVAPEVLPRLMSDLPAALLYVSNWWQIHSQQSYFETFGRPPILQHLWSLAIEEQFYLTWPVLVLFVLRRAGRRTLAVLCGLGAVACTAWMAVLHLRLAEGSDPSRLYLGADTQVMGLLLGATLACLIETWAPLPHRPEASTWWGTARRSAGARLAARCVGPAGLLALALLLLAAQRYHQASAALFRGGFLVVCALSCMLIVAALRPGTWLARLLGLPVMQWLGTRSFSLYLWHWPIVVWLWPAAGESAAQVLLTTAGRLALTALAAELSFRCVERARERPVGPIARIALRAAVPPILQPSRPLFIGGALALSVAAGALMLASGVVPTDAAASAAPASPARAAGPVQRDSAAAGPSTTHFTNPSDTAPPHAPQAAIQPAPLQALPPIERWAEVPEGGRHEPAPLAMARRDAAPHANAAASPARAVEAATEGVPGCVHIVGDSVVLGARQHLERVIGRAIVDAEVGRQGFQARQVLRDLLAQGSLCPKVVLHIGTNGYLPESGFIEMVRELAQRGPVVLVTLRAERRWTAANNQLIEQAGREVPHVRVVDWEALSSGRPDYFVSDGIHLTWPGMQAFAQEIRAALHGGPAASTTIGPAVSPAASPAPVPKAAAITRVSPRPPELEQPAAAAGGEETREAGEPAR
jgi:peptidoglycan/LPS O-acetylase OafA/YrhL